MTESATLVELSAAPLVHARYVEHVVDAGCGGVATFIGTTRNVFEGREVVKLEYEGYRPMAMKELKV